MGEAALKRITVDEFLLWNGEGDIRHELVGGEIVAMAPPHPYHSVVAANAIAAIKQNLKAPCRVASEAGIQLAWRNDTYYQADVAVTCQPLTQVDWAIPRPVLIVEVLSPSTESHDRGVKLIDYRQIASIQAIILIASDEKRVEFWRRGEGAWTVVDLDAADSIALDFLGFDIPVEALYDGLDFSQGAVAQA